MVTPQRMPVIETERLRLRLPGSTRDGDDGDLDADIDAMFGILRDPDVMKFITGRPMKRDEVAAALGRSKTYYALTNMGGFVVERKSDGQIIGDCLLVPIPHKGVDPSDAHARGPEVEVGYRFAKHAWGNGYATEAARAGIAYAFAEDGGNRDVVLGVTEPGNAASQKVLKKIGMNDLGLSEEFYNERLCLFSLTRDQWREQQAETGTT